MDTAHTNRTLNDNISVAHQHHNSGNGARSRQRSLSKTHCFNSSSSPFSSLPPTLSVQVDVNEARSPPPTHRGKNSTSRCARCPLLTHFRTPPPTHAQANRSLTPPTHSLTRTLQRINWRDSRSANQSSATKNLLPWLERYRHVLGVQELN